MCGAASKKSAELILQDKSVIFLRVVPQVKMMLEYGLRFLVGGFAVSAFAAIGDALRPKSFAGLFAAAPSIAPRDPPHHRIAKGRSVRGRGRPAR